MFLGPCCTSTIQLVLVPLFPWLPAILVRPPRRSPRTLALRESHEATVRILVGALEAKDPYTAGHAERVAEYAQYIGLELGIPPARLERLRLAALMHDVGKLVVPNHLLNKPGKLTAEEFAIVRKHEDVSVEILTTIEFLAPVAPSATSEAAQFSPVADDHGQPIEPHIVAVADAYDAMTSTRSYRRALPQDIAFAELREELRRQFHPRVVDALISSLRGAARCTATGTSCTCTTWTRREPVSDRPVSATCCPRTRVRSAHGRRPVPRAHELVSLAARRAAVARRGRRRARRSRAASPALGRARARRSWPASWWCCAPSPRARSRSRTPSCS